MCGIAGFTTYRNAPPDPAAVAEAMTRRLQPRGPDGHGIEVENGVVLGHRRLSIIDIEGGAQPMATEDGRYRITYNGEIYNYVELRAAMEQQGGYFSTRSDTEVLLKRVAAEGPKALRSLNGMFAFALWDRERRRLFLARDRIGIKPLYYTVCRGELIFASELKALLEHPFVERRINPLSLSKYLTFAYVPAPHTIFEGIHKLEPGTWMAFSEDGLEKESYWDIPLHENPIGGKSEDECAADILGLMEDAVRKRLRSDVPVGVFLSGGVDSGSIAALASRLHDGPVHTFSVGFEESTYDESPYALEVSRQYGTEHHHEILSLDTAVKMLPTVMAILDEPLGDASILPTYLLSQFTSQHVKVVLGGDGGDELFAGYPSFPAHRAMERLSVLPRSWRLALTRAVRRLPVTHRYVSLAYLLHQFFKGAGISPEIRWFLWMGAFGNEAKSGLLSEDLKQEILRQNPFEDIINYVRQSGIVSDFERLLYLSMKLYLQDDILVKVDRASMANSLEVRVPFLDHGLVEYASRLDSWYKLRGRTTKYILKHAVRDLLPRRIIHRRKAGFMIPVAPWIEKDLRNQVEELFSESSLARDGWFNHSFVRQMLDDHFAHRRDYRKELWALFSFMLWRENYYP